MKKINDFKCSFVLMVLVFSLFTISLSYADGLTEKGLADPEVISPGSVSSKSSSSSSSISVSSCEGLFANGFDASDNLMSSIFGLCLPGVLKNLDRLEQNECEQILCEYEAAQKGLSPILCAKKSSYNTCLITGEGFDVVEGILIGSLRQNIKQILENPLGLGIAQAKKYLKQQTSCKGPACIVPQKYANVALAAIEIPGSIQTLASLASQFDSFGAEQKTSCEKLEDIRPELEQIIDDYYASIGE